MGLMHLEYTSPPSDIHDQDGEPAYKEIAPARYIRNPRFKWRGRPEDAQGGVINAMNRMAQAKADLEAAKFRLESMRSELGLK